MTTRLAVAFTALLVATAVAQEPPATVEPAFEAVVIKRNITGSGTMSAESRPGGVEIMINGTLREPATAAARRCQRPATMQREDERWDAHCRGTGHGLSRSFDFRGRRPDDRG